MVQTQLAAARQPAPQDKLWQAVLPAPLPPASRPKETQPTSAPASREDLWQAVLVPSPLALPPLPPMPAMPNWDGARAASASEAYTRPSPSYGEFDFEPALRDRSRTRGSGAAGRTLTPPGGPPALPPAAEQGASASPKAAVKAAPNAAPLMAAPRLEEPRDTSRTPAPPAAAPPAAEKAAPPPPMAAPGAPSAAAAAAAATPQGFAPSTAAAAAAPAATSQRSAAAPAKPRWHDVSLECSDDETLPTSRAAEFQADGPPLVRVVTRVENAYIMLAVSPVVTLEALDIAMRSERPLLRIAALATFGGGGVRAGLVR